MDYASKGVGNTALGLSIGSLGAQLLTGGLSGLAGNANAGTQYVSKDLFEERTKLVDEQKKNAILEADLNTETKIVEAFKASIERENKIRDELKEQIYELDKKVDSNASAQAVMNTQMVSNVNLLQNQMSQLFGLTKLGIPNSSLCPGYGNVCVTPTGCGTVTGGTTST